MTAAEFFCGEEGTESSIGPSSTEPHGQLLRPSAPNLDHSILTSAISDEMPTFLHTTGVPIVDRRAKRLVSRGELARARPMSLTQGNTYPPPKPLCLRGHTPSMRTCRSAKLRPCRSIRGPRGAKVVDNGAFLRRGKLTGLCVSPWVIQEEEERQQRTGFHSKTLHQNPRAFHRKRERGNLLDYTEETCNILKFMLNDIHPIRDHGGQHLAKQALDDRREDRDDGDSQGQPEFYDIRLELVRPRTIGYSPGHVRSLSPTPRLTWGSRFSSRANLEWDEGAGGPLGAVEAALAGAAGCFDQEGGRRLCRPIHLMVSTQGGGERFDGSCGFGAKSSPGSLAADRGEDNACAQERQNIAGMGESTMNPQAQRMDQSMFNGTLGSSFPPQALRPFSSPLDHLGKRTSRGVLTRSTRSLKSQQFDTTQRRLAYVRALDAKRRARVLRVSNEAGDARLEREREKTATEARGKIEEFENNLKEVLARKWKYL